VIALAVLAFVAGGLALLRYAVALPLFARYLHRARVAAIPRGPTPPLSVLKPLYGTDPGLAENLERTLRQNYPRFEVLFVHERPDDPALEAARAAARAVPDVPVRFVAGRADGVVNPKAAVLVRGAEEAREERLVAADSDVRPDPLWLRDVANGLAVADAVSFAPVLFGMRTLPARLAGLAANTDGFLTVVLTNGAAMTGATIGVTRASLEHVGGWRAVGDRMAEDYALGEALKRAGFRLALARRAARIHFPGEGGRATWRWTGRWLRTIRSAAPGWYVAGALPACAPLLLLATAAATPWTAPALRLLAGITAIRAALAVVVDFRFCWDRSLVRALPLLPLLWVLEPLGYLSGLFGGTVTWRGRRYRLKAGRVSLPK